ncbi:hypothetical protein ABI125_01545 [Tamlana crocina]
MKVAGLHVISHSGDQDHTEHCIVCDHAIAHNLTPALVLEELSFSVESTIDIVQEKEIADYHFALSNTIAANQLFSRPPPAL